ncbi:MAG: tellurite resistance TerB family protein [Sulfitobacter sp.]|nr:tellurite resistance TerB family protein [Sulfitobacter sp.]
MSLMKTLAKVAVGVAVAKGAQSMMKRSAQGGGSGGGLGGLLGGLAGGAAGGSRPHGGAHSTGGGLEDMLGGLLGGGAGSKAGGGMPGGLGGLLEQLGGSGGAGGGLGGLLGGLAGAAGAGGLLGGASRTVQKRPERNDRDFGAVLNSQFDANPEPEIEPSQDQEAAAGLMLAAMIQAAKSDGTFDEAEKDKLLGQLGDVDAEEAAFVQAQLQAPIDVDGLVRQTPQGMGPQIYAMSVLGIDLDSQQEAQYLHQLAQGYGMTPAEVNDIHAQMGVPSLYT